MKYLTFLLILFCTPLFAKEIALSFDDAPVNSTHHFESAKRTDELIKKLKSLNVPGVMIFANPCKDEVNGISQLKKYVDAGHIIANHTCTHPRL